MSKITISESTITLSAIDFGIIIAITASWSINHSILWAIIHGVLGWFYVIYYAINY